MAEETKEVWVIVDEAPPKRKIKAICDVKATAIRLVRETCSTSLTISSVNLVRQGAVWFGPVDIIEPSRTDVVAQAKLDMKYEAEKKARELGLTEAEIDALSY
ncbi:MAG: hypothetical protein ACK5MY_02405 [Jhaorihella sp.]